MDFNKLTIKSQEAVAAAQELARRRGNPEIYPEHLLLALLDQELFADWQHLRAEAEQKVAVAPERERRAAAAADLVRVPRRCSTAPTGSARSSRTTSSRASTCSSRSSRRRARRSSQWIKTVRGGQRVTSQDPEGSYQALAKFGRDLTEAAEAGQARPGDRPRRGDPPRDPDPLAPHEEQPGADRRAGRRQDRDRRGARAADRRRRRARGPEGPPRLGRSTSARCSPARSTAASSRSGSRPCSTEIQSSRGPDRPLHRRAAHDRRRRRGRGRRRRGEPAQADARARRAALRRRDDARRVPQAHREGRGARAALRAGVRRRAERAPTRSRSCAG